MPRHRSFAPPKYRLYRPKNLAVVRIDGRDRYLGKYGSPESLEAYRKLLVEHAFSVPTQIPGAAPPSVEAAPGTDGSLTVDDVLNLYRRFAREYYSVGGEPTEEYRNQGYAAAAVRKQFGRTTAAEFGPSKLKAVQWQLVEEGKLCRRVINRRVNRIRRIRSISLSRRETSNRRTIPMRSKATPIPSRRAAMPPTVSSPASCRTPGRRTFASASTCFSPLSRPARRVALQAFPLDCGPWALTPNEPAASRSRIDVSLPNWAVGLASIGGLIAFSVVGCYVYYPDSETMFANMVRTKTEVIATARTEDWELTEKFIPIMETEVRDLLIGVYLREFALSDYRRMKARVLLQKLELLEHAVEDGHRDEVEDYTRDVETAYRRLRDAFAAPQLYSAG